MTSKSNEWVNRWSSPATFISCTFWALQYKHEVPKTVGSGFDKPILIHKKGIASFHIEQEKLDAFGKHAASIAQDTQKAAQLLNQAKQNWDALQNIMKKHKEKVLTKKEYNEFAQMYDRCLGPHNFMKKAPDYLEKDHLQKLLPLFTEARVYTEQIYGESERFLQAYAKAIAEKEKRNEKTLTCLARTEIEHYLETGTLPEESILQSRYEMSVVTLQNGMLQILVGNEAKQIEKHIYKKDKQVRGRVVYREKIQGTCRIIHDVTKPYIFEKGDILVTGMTKPEFVPLMKQAGAIVTDVGGILCHAAIVAKELKIPCIIGTKNATKVLENGKQVVVDTHTGIVTLL